MVDVRTYVRTTSGLAQKLKCWACAKTNAHKGRETARVYELYEVFKSPKLDPPAKVTSLVARETTRNCRVCVDIKESQYTKRACGNEIKGDVRLA